MVCSVALCSPPYSTLSYLVPDGFPGVEWKPGLRVAVPLGNGAVRAGVITSIGEAPDLQKNDGNGRAIELRAVTWPLEKSPLLPEDYMGTVAQLASRQCATPGRILGTIMPQGLRVTARIRVRQYTGPGGAQGGKPRMLALRDIPLLEEEDRRRLACDYIEGRAEILMLAEDAAAGEMCVLACEPPWQVRPNAVRQRELLDWLLHHGTVSRLHLREALPECSAALAQLVKAGLVELRPAEPEENDDDSGADCRLLPPPDAAFELTEAQQSALASCCEVLDGNPGSGSGKFARLLYGVTGSGKTAVYLEVARACLQRGRTALVLAPEVAIALKLRRDAERRFPHAEVVFYHGYQSPQLRERIFRSMAVRRDPCIVIGTRSALFLPVPKLGAVILDEEHDASFKQEDRLPYQAKEVAWERAQRHGALLLLGSATPDIKTFHAAEKGLFPVLRLPSRVGGGTTPSLEFVDIRKQPASKLLAPRSLEVLRETVRRGEQAVILLNRRGYAPLMYCLSCGTSVRCPNCDISLTYHKRREQLVCHYCGHTQSFPTPCSKCGSTNFLPMGQGTERLEEVLADEELADVLPHGSRILRLDRDSTSRPGRMEEILEAFARQESQVLVGTQMLSKGHHFPNVTLALIADGDMGLNLPDYRSAERTFQLLVQSAGRAGRGGKPGQVLIQTRDMGHYCWQFVKDSDYEGFYARELALREKRRYPPFVKLAIVRISYPREEVDGAAKLGLFSASFRRRGSECGLSVLGPAPAPLANLQGRMRFQCLVKGTDWKSIRAAYGAALRDTGSLPKEMRIQIDLDPVNML